MGMLIVAFILIMCLPRQSAQRVRVQLLGHASAEVARLLRISAALGSILNHVLLVIVEVCKDLVELSLHLLNLSVVFLAFFFTRFIILRLFLLSFLAVVPLPCDITVAPQVLSKLALFLSALFFALLAQELGHVLELLSFLSSKLRGCGAIRHLIVMFSINSILRRQMKSHILLQI